jgi:hypothetical protein
MVEPVAVSRSLKVQVQGLAIIFHHFPFRIEKRPAPTPTPTMTAQSAVPTETYREKALRKFKQQPLVPVGATLTLSSLIIPFFDCMLTDEASQGRPPPRPRSSSP